MDLGRVGRACLRRDLFERIQRGFPACALAAWAMARRVEEGLGFVCRGDFFREKKSMTRFLEFFFYMYNAARARVFSWEDTRHGCII